MRNYEVKVKVGDKEIFSVTLHDDQRAHELRQAPPEDIHVEVWRITETKERIDKGLRLAPLGKHAAGEGD
jgi:hypothetical protein